MKEHDVFGLDIDLFAERMLENGFYPEDLPPVFAIENFYKSAKDYIKNKNYLSKKPTEPGIYNASKRGGSRRNFEIPNPISMVDLAIFYSEYSSQISEHFQINDDSLSAPTFQNERRPIRITSHSELHKIRRQKLSTSRYIVRTDISRYFHSIYTHSISWALHGKTEANRDRSIESTTVFGNRLDQIIRQSKGGQTIGISVGPDFSRFTSEIIGKAIDAKFRDKNGDQHMLIRHVDDIFIGADDYDEANHLLTSIRDAIQHFQLDINDRKTSIVATNLDLEPFWPVRTRREIEEFSGKNPSEKASTTGHDFVYFLDEIVRIANNENDDGVIKYSLRRMDDLKIWSNYWSLVEPFLVRAAINFPHCWDYIARIVSWRHLTGAIDKHLWQKVVSKSLAIQSRSGHDSEVCWALWLAKEVGLSIELPCLETILERCGALSATLALDVYESNGHNYKFPKSKLFERIGDQPMMGENWLLAYEADRLFGHKIKTKNLNGSILFKEFYDNDAEFYNRSASLFLADEDDDDNMSEFALMDVGSYYDDDYDEDTEDEDEDEDDIDF